MRRRWNNDENDEDEFSIFVGCWYCSGRSFVMAKVTFVLSFWCLGRCSFVLSCSMGWSCSFEMLVSRFCVLLSFCSLSFSGRRKNKICKQKRNTSLLLRSIRLRRFVIWFVGHAIVWVSTRGTNWPTWPCISLNYASEDKWAGKEWKSTKEHQREVYER